MKHRNNPLGSSPSQGEVRRGSRIPPLRKGRLGGVLIMFKKTKKKLYNLLRWSQKYTKTPRFLPFARGG